MENMDNMLITELEEHYRQLEQQIQQMEAENMTEQEELAFEEYQEIRKFYTDVANSLGFVSQSAELTMNDGNMEIGSMLKPEEYGQLLTTLSTGRNPEFEQFLQMEKSGNLTEHERQYELQLMQKMPENVMQSTALYEAVKSAERSEYLVSEVKDAVEQSEQLMQMYGIDKSDSVEQTGIVFRELEETDKLIILPKDRVTEQQLEEQYEEEKPVVITESGDGEILNTSKTLTAGNIGQAIMDNGNTAYVENGNEIHHKVPVETTNDPSRVTSVIHMEEANEISTLEAEFGITEQQKEEFGIEM